MVVSSKLQIIQDHFEQNITLDSSDNRIFTYLVLAEQDLQVKLNVDVLDNSSLELKIIVVNVNSNNINIDSNVNVAKDNNNCKVQMLCYGMNKSKTKLVSNVSVGATTQNNHTNQMITGILLSPNAKIIGEPNLQINALNVYAKHSLNIGTLDKAEIFYLMSKKIPLKETKQILIHAYLIEMLKELDESQTTLCLQKIHERID